MLNGNSNIKLQKDNGFDILAISLARSGVASKLSLERSRNIKNLDWQMNARDKGQIEQHISAYHVTPGAFDKAATSIS